MLKISKKASVTLSLIISVLFFAVLIVFAAVMPWVVEALLKFPGEITARVQPTELGKTLSLIAAYLILFVAALADSLLFSLLLRVYKGKVFTPQSVALIRGISWCSIFVGLIFLALTYYFTLAIIVAFAAMFLGLCVRVVKNVIEQATEIKYENDLTV